MKNLKKIVLASLVAGVGLSIAACSGNTVTPFDVSSSTTISKISCTGTNNAHDVSNEVAQVISLPPGKDHDQAFAAWHITDATKTAVSNALNKRAADCGDKAAVVDNKVQKGTTDVIDSAGNRASVPFVSGENITTGDTRTSTTMPSLSKLLPDCGILIDWQSLVDCVNQNHAQWYIDGVNARSASTGFTWDDVVKWGSAKLPDGSKPEVRVIQEYKQNLDDTTARSNVAGILGADVANNPAIKVLKYQNNAFANTWRTDSDDRSMTTFADYNAEERVTLAPLVLNDDGSVKGILQGVPSGVFVDCYNLHWFFPIVPETPGSSLVCPPNTANHGQPMNGGLAACTPPGQTPPPPPPGCTNCTPPPPCTTCTTLEAKNPAQDPSQNGNAGNGGGKNQDPGPGIYVPPSQVTQPPATSRTNPAPPTATQPPAPPVVTVQPGPVTTTVNPGTQPPNSGTVNPNPTTGSCNPDFQNC